MAYRFDPSETFTDEFRRIAAEQLTSAREALQEQPDGVHAAIHTMRKRFKRLRSLYRLVASDARAFRAFENARLRDTARSLSPVRDATALVEVSRYLQRQAGNNAEAAAFERITGLLATRQDHLAQDDAHLAARTGKAMDACNAGLDALDRVHFDDRGRATARRMAKSWKKALKQAQRALATCGNDTGNASFHQLRKRCQDYRQYLELAHRLWPSAMLVKGVAVKEVTDLLGHHNDLAVLSALAGRQPGLFGGSDDLALLGTAIADRQRDLQTEALKKARALFSGPPSEEADIIAALWLNARS